jgi:WD40 repeat protein
VELLDVASATVKRRLQGPEGLVSSLVFSPDGKMLATGGELRTGNRDVVEGRVYLWSLE